MLAQAEIETLEQALNTEPTTNFLVLLREKAKQYGWTKLERETGISRQGMHQALSERGNPQFATVHAILKALGVKITVTVK